jgi:hypothetical protein
MEVMVIEIFKSNGSESRNCLDTAFTELVGLKEGNDASLFRGHDLLITLVCFKIECWVADRLLARSDCSTVKSVK